VSAGHVSVGVSDGLHTDTAAHDVSPTFTYAGPSAWNSLRAVADTAEFRKQLKISDGQKLTKYLLTFG